MYGAGYSGGSSGGQKKVQPSKKHHMFLMIESSAVAVRRSFPALRHLTEGQGGSLWSLNKQDKSISDEPLL